MDLLSANSGLLVKKIFLYHKLLYIRINIKINCKRVKMKEWGATFFYQFTAYLYNIMLYSLFFFNIIIIIGTDKFAA